MAQIEILTKEDLNNFKDDLLKEIKAILAHSDMSTSHKEWLRSRDVRKMLNISPGSLQNLRINGTLRFTKMDKIIFYKYEDIIKALEKNSLR